MTRLPSKQIEGFRKLAIIADDTFVNTASTMLGDADLTIAGIKPEIWYAFKAVLLTEVVNGEEGGGMKVDFDNDGGDAFQFLNYDIQLNDPGGGNAPKIMGKGVSAVATAVTIWNQAPTEEVNGKIIVEGVLQGPADGAEVSPTSLRFRHALVQAVGDGAESRIKRGSFIELRRE